jgi:hypothetical protein
VCEDIAIGEEEKCVDMVKLKKEKHGAKNCSFHPKTICKKTDRMTCRRVAKKMCHSIPKYCFQSIFVLSVNGIEKVSVPFLKRT